MGLWAIWKGELEGKNLKSDSTPHVSNHTGVKMVIQGLHFRDPSIHTYIHKKPVLWGSAFHACAITPPSPLTQPSNRALAFSPTVPLHSLDGSARWFMNEQIARGDGERSLYDLRMIEADARERAEGWVVCARVEMCTRL